MRKIPFAGIELTSQRVRGLRGTYELPGRPGKITFSLSPFAPENLISRDGFGSPVQHQPGYLHTQADEGAYLRDSSRVPRRRPFIYWHDYFEKKENFEIESGAKCSPESISESFQNVFERHTSLQYPLPPLDYYYSITGPFVDSASGHVQL